MSRVAVVITCYNYGAYLPRAIESALGQTHEDLEIVVVNDGSTDDTGMAASRYLVDPRVSVVALANGGQARAKNAGLRATKAEYVAFLDADDAWEPSKLEKQLPLFEDPAVGVVYSRMRFVDPDGRPCAHPPRELPPFRGDALRPLLRDNFVPFSSAVARRECFQESGLFDESLPMAIDWDLWLRFSLRYRFDYVDEPLVAYRLGHSGQMSKDLLRRQACCDRIFARFVAAHAERINRADLRRARAHTYNSRGYFFRRRDPAASLRYYGLSLRENPFQWKAIKGATLTARGLVRWGKRTND
ncbi:MAG: glycosyltransferase [Elusimicrobia bacterium]|nr:glycosyltransferase [Elusimicrobiota bacterium]